MLTPLLKNMTCAIKHQVGILQTCARWINHGDLQLSIHKEYPLKNAALAHEQLATPGKREKIV